MKQPEMPPPKALTGAEYLCVFGNAPAFLDFGLPTQVFDDDVRFGHHSAGRGDDVALTSIAAVKGHAVTLWPVNQQANLKEGDGQIAVAVKEQVVRIDLTLLGKACVAAKTGGQLGQGRSWRRTGQYRAIQETVTRSDTALVGTTVAKSAPSSDSVTRRTVAASIRSP